MANEKIYVKGFRTFSPNANAPEWVLGDLVIDLAEFKEFINNNLNLLTDYNGKKQLKCQITKGQKGLTISVNTFKPQQKQQPQNTHSVMSGPATPLEDDNSQLPF